MASEHSDIHDSAFEHSTTSGSTNDDSALWEQGAEHFTQYTTASDYRRMINHLKEEIAMLREDNTMLRAQHVEISSTSVKQQQQYSAMQSQVDNIKNTIRMQLASPISEQEYFRIEALPEGDRSVIDTIKIGVYQQIGALKSAKDAAVKRGSELAAELERAASDCKKLAITVQDKDVIHENEVAGLKRQLTDAEQKGSLVAELQGRVKDLQLKLDSVNNDQERIMQSKLELAAKTKELMHTELQLREALNDVAAFKAEARCAEEKLDILKAEYYDVRLKYSEEQLTLQNRLQVAEERLKMLNDVETEAEVFIANIAAQDNNGNSEGVANQLATIPASRKMQHAVTMTKKCLSLENQLTTTKLDSQQKDMRIDRLERSLAMAQDVLHGSSPYKLVEDTVSTLQRDNDELKQQLDVCRAENVMLVEKNKAYSTDIATLSRHRAEMTRIRDLLVQLGATPTLTQHAPLPIHSSSSGSADTSSRKHGSLMQSEIMLPTDASNVPSAPSMMQAQPQSHETSAAFIPGSIEIA